MNTNSIKKGFNNGYLLKTHMPDLAKKFAKVIEKRDDPYALGFLAGIKERERELIRTRGKNFDVRRITTIKSQQKDKDKDQDRDFIDR